jgi:soluble cytochrome b562
MSRDGMDGDDMDLVEICDQALEAACSGLLQTAEHAAPELRQYRNAYDGNGEYEFPTASHYVPQYWRS